MDSLPLTPIIIAAVLIAVVLIAITLIAKNYIKVSPNKAAVISGRKRKLPDGTVVGYRIVRGGATLVVPFLEKYEILDLNVMQVGLDVRKAYTMQGVPVGVKAVANIKLKGDDQSLRAAAERFLGMPQDRFRDLVFQTLEGHLRAILGTLTVEQINNDRQMFSQQLTAEAAADLEKMGLGLEPVVIQEVSDEQGYLDSLGKRRVAEVQRDAAIGAADAERETKVRSSEARRQGEAARLMADAQVAESERETNIKKAQYQAEINAEQAKAAQAGPLAEATAQKQVVVAQAEVERAQTEAQIAVQEVEARRKEKELEATVIKEAEATQRAVTVEAEGERQAAQIRAEGERKAAVIRAEGQRDAAIATAEAERQAVVARAEGEAARLRATGNAQAEATTVTAQAEAERIRATGLAEAEATTARLTAEAEGIRAKGLAEAEAVQKKAEAWAQFNEAAKLQTILEKLPEIIASAGPIFEAVAKPLSNIDKVVMIDQGNGNGTSPMNKLASTGPGIIFGLLQQAQAMGLNVNAIKEALLTGKEPDAEKQLEPPAEP